MVKRRICTLFIPIFLVSIFSYLLIGSNFSYSQETETEVPEWLKRISFGADVGTNQKPRIYFETVQPLYQDEDKQNTFFIQPRISYENEDGAYNLGFGYRRLLYDNSVLLGTNLFFDFEDDDKHYRTGLGLEAFVNLIEFRANSYIGLSPRRLINEVGTQREYEKAVDGFDWEIGLPIPYMNWIKVYGGGYWYNYEKFKNKEGWRVRTELKPFKITTINFIAYDDNKGDPEFRVDGRVTIPFGAGGENDEKFSNLGFSKTPYPEEVDHSDRILDRVEREYKIEVERYVETASAIVEVRRGN